MKLTWNESVAVGVALGVIFFIFILSSPLFREIEFFQPGESSPEYDSGFAGEEANAVPAEDVSPDGGSPMLSPTDVTVE